MRCTIEKLLNGKHRVVSWFRTANEKWDEVFAQIATEIAASFGLEQCN